MSDKCLDDELYDIYIQDGNQIIECLREIYEKGRADAIDEYLKKVEFEDKWLLACKVYDPNVAIAFRTLKSYAEQLKEQK